MRSICAFLMLLLSASIQAQTPSSADSLIVVNKDISLRFYQSLVFRGQYSLDIKLAFYTQKGVIIKDFYFNQKKLSRQKEQVNEVFQDDPSDPQKRYFSLRGISTPYSIGDAQQANFEPGEKLTVRYIKNGRTYYAKIPFEKLRISFARPPMDH